MFNKIQEIINTWFPKYKAKIEESASEIEAKVINIDAEPISNSLFNSLETKIKELEVNLVYKNLVQKNLSESLEKWSKKIPLTNHLVIMGLPVENLEKICRQSLDDLTIEKVHFIEKIAIEYDENILINYLTDQLNKINKSEEKQVIIIPDLSNLFLRSVKGLDIIETLLVSIKENQNNFWLIGCSNWLWNYLNKVCQIASYLDNKISLPSLTDEDLKQWLAPVFENFQSEWLSVENLEKEKKEEINLEECRNEAEKKFFQNLASVACGSQLIAGNVWLNSLSVIKVNLEEKEEDTKKASEETEEDKEIKTKDKIITKLPIVPNFPSLQQGDRLLLVAVGLQGKISIKNLAFILGEDLLNIKAQVFNLIKLKILNYDANLVSLNPLFYPKLIKDLQSNNLLIDLEKN